MQGRRRTRVLADLANAANTALADALAPSPCRASAPHEDLRRLVTLVPRRPPRPRSRPPRRPRHATGIVRGPPHSLGRGRLRGRSAAIAPASVAATATPPSTVVAAPRPGRFACSPGAAQCQHGHQRDACTGHSWSWVDTRAEQHHGVAEQGRESPIRGCGELPVRGSRGALWSGRATTDEVRLPRFTPSRFCCYGLRTTVVSRSSASCAIPSSIDARKRSTFMSSRGTSSPRREAE